MQLRTEIYVGHVFNAVSRILDKTMKVIDWIEGLKELLEPTVKTVVKMTAMTWNDPMITGVK